MCKNCEINPVYQFTNKRKLCKNCFINYFQKKVLYIIRKFKMADHSSVIYFSNSGSFRDVVLEEILKMFAEKSGAELVKLSHPPSPEKVVNDKENFKLGSIVFSNNQLNTYNKNLSRSSEISSKNKKITKIAVSDSADIISERIIYSLFEGNLKKLKNVKPVKNKIIRPLYLMLDKEILLYAKLKCLKFKNIKEKEKKFDNFIKSMEEKHPELKHAVVNSYLELFVK